MPFGLQDADEGREVAIYARDLQGEREENARLRAEVKRLQGVVEVLEKKAAVRVCVRCGTAHGPGDRCGFSVEGFRVPPTAAGEWLPSEGEE